MKFALFLFFLLLYKTIVYSQQYSFINYSVEDGLAQSQVFDVESDLDGYVWSGTAGGVSRFDGKSFKNYSTENGLIDNTVKKILNHNNTIWIASQYGVTAVSQKQITSWDLHAIADGYGITSFTFDLVGNLWLAIRGEGVYKIPVVDEQLRLSEITNYSLSDKNLIKCIYCDQKGLIWVGGRNIIGFFENEKWNRNILMLDGYTVSSFTQDNEGEFMFSTSENGMYKLVEGEIEHIELSENFGSINHLYTDNKARLWISTNNGVYLIEDKEIVHFNTNNGLINNRVKDITEDHEGNIWLGTDGGGIARFTNDELVSYSKKDGMSSDYVLSITEVDSLLYFSTYGGGINIFKDGSFKAIDSSNSNLGDNTVWTSIYNKKDSSLLFGTANGLFSLKNEEISTFKNEKWLTSNKILSLYNEEDKGLWIGTSKGVSLKTKKGKDRLFKYQKNFPAKNVRTIEKSLSGSIWVGTSSGIYEILDSVVTPVKFNLDLSNQVVYCVKYINDQLLFIGTGSGLYSYDGNKLVKVDLHDSFSANSINFIGVENSNHVWIGTNYGVFEINIEQYLTRQSNSVHHYTTTNGLPSIETNLNSFFKDKMGNLWMGTSKGVVRFTRKHENHDFINPIVKLDKVQLFLKETDWSNYAQSIDEKTKLPINLSVGYKKNYFTFYYDAIAIKQNKEIKYSVLLEGLDVEWSPPLKQNSVTYTNLPHGNYIFRVKASIDGRNWSKVDSFSFEVQKPYYLTFWFFLLVFFMVLVILLIIWKWQLNISKRKSLTQKLYYKSKLLALEQQTLNASMNRHFIFNSLNSIQYYINTKDRLSANKYLTNFAKLIRKNLDSSISGTNLVPLSDELERLELYLSLENMRFQNKFTYCIEVMDDLDISLINVPPMFLQPYVENSIWHGILPIEKKGEIKVLISSSSKDNVLFSIEDNGLGIDESLANKNDNDHASKGMVITTGRLDILKKTTNQEFIVTGPYQIEDDQGNVQGTRVEIMAKRIKV